MRLRVESTVLVLIAMALLLAVAGRAQIRVEKPLHLSYVHGYVLSETGKPFVGVQVALASGGPPSQAMKTDANGYFDFSNAKGEYLLHVKVPEFGIADRQVVVGAGLRALRHQGPIFVMIKPGICMDCTSPVFTSRKQFDRAIRLLKTSHD
jgi:hypothetical protein